MKWPNCPDFVIVLDGVTSWSEKLKALCGGAEGWERKIVSSKNGMRVEFKSNKDGSAPGFMATYTATPVDEGNQILKKKSIWEKKNNHKTLKQNVFTGINTTTEFGVICGFLQ